MPATKRTWEQVVALMRRDVRELGREPEHAARFLARYHGSIDALTAQFRRSWALNAHEMQAVTTLWEFGRMTMTELGRRIPLSRAAVTTLTDRLERLGLVKRVPDPSDRRRILLEVTDRVEQEAARINAAWNSSVEAYVRGLDPAVWANVVDVMADLRSMSHVEADDLRSQSMDDVERGAGGEKPRRSARGGAEDAPQTWW
ncbi:MAG: putative MarR family transcriptional regulator [Thermoleophilia bacterium]|nr:putative MarR family transcriptional regulator [Thermoleophilia bacterium]